MSVHFYDLQESGNLRCTKFEAKAGCLGGLDTEGPLERKQQQHRRPGPDPGPNPFSIFTFLEIRETSLRMSDLIINMLLTPSTPTTKTCITVTALVFHYFVNQLNAREHQHLLIDCLGPLCFWYEGLASVRTEENYQCHV